MLESDLRTCVHSHTASTANSQLKTMIQINAAYCNVLGPRPRRLRICDMIKGNESDVWNIDFELQAKKGDKFLSFSLFLNFQELIISLQPDVQLDCEFFG